MSNKLIIIIETQVVIQEENKRLKMLIITTDAGDINNKIKDYYQSSIEKDNYPENSPLNHFNIKSQNRHTIHAWDYYPTMSDVRTEH